MRTTIRLDEKLLREAKRLAAESGTTLTAVIEEALRERIARRKAGTRTRPAVRLRVVGKGGVRLTIRFDAGRPESTSSTPPCRLALSRGWSST